MPCFVPRFVHRPGVHCGSTGLADVLRLHGWDLSEPMVLGLGGSTGVWLFDGAAGMPERFFLGRGTSFEQRLCRRIGAALQWREEAWDQAWPAMAASVAAGVPCLVLTDLRHLPYYGARGSFHGHLAVLAGRGGAEVWLADAHFPGLQQVPLTALEAAAVSCAPPVGDGLCHWGVIAQLPEPPSEAALRALARAAAVDNAQACLTAADGAVASLQSLRAELPAWAVAPDSSRRARFAAQVIERRGNGGGLFRRMYADFLSEIGLDAAADRARAAASAWSVLALGFERAASDRSAWGALASRVDDVAAAERALWTSVATAG